MLTCFFMICFETLQNLLILTNFSLALSQLPVALGLGLISLKVTKGLVCHFEMVIIGSCIGLQIFCLYIKFQSELIIFESLTSSYYCGWAMAFSQRLLAENIPTFRLKILFQVLAFFGNIILVQPDEAGSYIHQIALFCVGIYLDFARKSLENDFFSKNSGVRLAKSFVDDIPEGIAVISTDLKKGLFMNKFLREMFKNDDMMRILNQLIVVPQHDSGVSLLSFLQTNHTGQTCTIRNEEGSLLTAKVFSTEWEGNSAIGIMIQSVPQMAADSHRDRVLATVSHELRTPLNGMLGMIQIIMKRVRDAELLHYLSICQNSGNLLMALVNSILDLNQIRSNKLRLFPERVSLSGLVKDLFCLFELQCKQKGLFLALKMAPNLPISIITDKNRLSQILINLIGNALKFTFKGGITLSITHAAKSPNELQFSVEDTGIGIKAEDQKKLFQMFGRLEQSNRNINCQGVGLGLTISNNLVRMLNENNDGIFVKSKFGEGTTFSFCIKKKLAEITMSDSFDSIEIEPSSLDASLEGFLGLEQRMQGYAMLAPSNIEVLHGLHIASLVAANQQKQMVPTKLTNYMTQMNIESPNNLCKMGGLFRSELEIGKSPRKKTQINVYILIVDDYPFNLTVAEHLIIGLGYKVKSAVSGQAAIEEVTEHCQNTKEPPIKLILMDCQMPVMDGYETTKALKDLMREKRIPEIPIVALTANDSEIDRQLCTEIGMCDYLSKPLKESVLKRILYKYIRN